MTSRYIYPLILVIASCGNKPPAFAPSELPQPGLSGNGSAVVELLKTREKTVLDVLLLGKQNPSESVGQLGLAYQAFNFRAEALTCYQLAVSADPENPKWVYFQGMMQKRLAQPNAAFQSFSKVLILKPDHVPSLLETADHHRQMHEVARARFLFEKALKHQPQSVAAMAGLAKLAMSERHYQDALNLLNEALTLQENGRELFYLQAMAWKGLGNMVEARSAMDRHDSATGHIWRKDSWKAELEDLENLFSHHLDAGDEAAEKGQLQVALASYVKARAFNPKHYEASTKYAWSLLQTGQQEAALKAYGETLELRSNNPVVHYNIGGILAELGRDESAVEAFQKALEHNPEMTISQLFLADALRRLGRLDQAVIAYEKTLALDPKETAARLGRALTLIKKNRHDQALEALSQDLKIMPDQKALTLTKARLLAASPFDNLRDGMAAVDLVKPLVQGRPDLDTAETIAMVMAEAGRMDLAVKYQGQAIEMARMGSANHRLPFLETNLKKYEVGKPCRTPWAAEDPLFRRKTYKR